MITMIKMIKDKIEDIFDLLSDLMDSPQFICFICTIFLLGLAISSLFFESQIEKLGESAIDKIVQYNCVSETKTIPIVFQENIIENVNGSSVLGSGHVNTKNNYTVYKILDDGGKELYPINSNNTIIYDILEPDAQEYLEEDYNYHDVCLAVRIYTHKWDS